MNKDYKAQHIEGFKALFGRFLVEIAIPAFKAQLPPSRMLAGSFDTERFFDLAEAELIRQHGIAFLHGKMPQYIADSFCSIYGLYSAMGMIYRKTPAEIEEILNTPRAIHDGIHTINVHAQIDGVPAVLLTRFARLGFYYQNYACCEVERHLDTKIIPPGVEKFPKRITEDTIEEFIRLTIQLIRGLSLTLSEGERSLPISQFLLGAPVMILIQEQK